MYMYVCDSPTRNVCRTVVMSKCQALSVLSVETLETNNTSECDFL